MKIFRILNLFFTKTAILAILIYKRCISVFIPPCCIYHPTCSEYASEAFHRHGFFSGFYLTARRLLRCHPFKEGGVDEVPEIFSFFRPSTNTQPTNLKSKYG